MVLDYLWEQSSVSFELMLPYSEVEKKKTRKTSLIKFNEKIRVHENIFLLHKNQIFLGSECTSGRMTMHNSNKSSLCTDRAGGYLKNFSKMGLIFCSFNSFLIDFGLQIVMVGEVKVLVITRTTGFVLVRCLPQEKNEKQEKKRSN